jgi:hypothetical protein
MGRPVEWRALEVEGVLEDGFLQWVFPVGPWLIALELVRLRQTTFGSDQMVSLATCNFMFITI